MADTKISALTGASAVAAANEFAINEAGTSKKVTAAQLATFMGPNSNWRFLGAANGSGVTVGPVIWTGTYKHFFFQYKITGCNGAIVGRILTGAAAISTTGATNGNSLMSGVTLNATSINAAGCPLAVTISNLPRSGWGFIQGESGALKEMHIHGMNGTPAVGTVPTQFTAHSFFSDLGTNLPLQRIQLTCYALLTGGSTSGTFNAGTRIAIWGRNDD